MDSTRKSFLRRVTGGIKLQSGVLSEFDVSPLCNPARVAPLRPLGAFAFDVVPVFPSLVAFPSSTESFFTAGGRLSLMKNPFF